MILESDPLHFTFGGTPQRNLVYRVKSHMGHCGFLALGRSMNRLFLFVTPCLIASISPAISSGVIWPTRSQHIRQTRCCLSEFTWGKSHLARNKSLFPKTLYGTHNFDDNEWGP